MERPWQWQPGGACIDTRDGTVVDKDACEGTYNEWYSARQEAVKTGTTVQEVLKKRKSSGLPNWVLPAAVGAVVLLLVLRK